MDTGGKLLLVSTSNKATLAEIKPHMPLIKQFQVWNPIQSINMCVEYMMETQLAMEQWIERKLQYLGKKIK